MHRRPPSSLERSLQALVLAALPALGACAELPEEAPIPRPGEPYAFPFEPAGSRLRRITRSQYAATVRAVLGPDVVVPRPADLEPDSPDDGLVAVGTTVTTISPRGVEQYAAAAYDLAEQAMEPGLRERLVPCAPTGAVDPGCAAAALGPIGAGLYRRPLSVEELDDAVALATNAGATLGDFYDGLEFGVAYFLQSPSFLFREELGEPSGARDGALRYGGFELASRMAYFLWNGPPDQALRDAAAAGALDTEEGVRSEAERMLDDPRARAGLRAFVEDWLNLRELDRMVKDPTVFVHASPDVGPAAREETVRVFQHLVLDEPADIRELMTTRTTFVDRRLAAIYGVRAPREPFGRIELPADGPRRGLLGQVGVLAPNAHPTATSPTRRGAFIRERLLCETVPAPPANVNTAIPEPSPDARTLRERLFAHQRDPVCRSCHLQLDNVAFGLEIFDSLGVVRTTDNGVPIDPSGDLDGVPYRNFLELAEHVQHDPRFPRCVATQAFRVAVGRHEERGETGELRRIYTRFANGGFRFRELMIEIVASRAFREATPAPGAGEPEVMP
jgi:hypothetical protein